MNLGLSENSKIKFGKSLSKTAWPPRPDRTGQVIIFFWQVIIFFADIPRILNENSFHVKEWKSLLKILETQFFGIVKNEAASTIVPSMAFMYSSD